MPLLIVFVILLWPILIIAMVPALALRYFGVINTDYTMLTAPLWIPAAIAAIIATVVGLIALVGWFWVLIGALYQ
jgi:hypothetical protein